MDEFDSNMDGKVSWDEFRTSLMMLKEKNDSKARGA